MKKNFFDLASTVLVLLLIFCSSCSVVFQFGLVNAVPTTIVVPDDYPLIQDAIDAAQDGDTIFVKNGVYYETLIINKSLTLIGENREQTIIDAGKLIEDVVNILANHVTLTNFTLGHTGYIFSSGQTHPNGIFIEGGDVNITHNTIYGVHGPAFNLGYTGSATFHDNIVAESTFVIINRFLMSNTPTEDQAVEVKNMSSPFPADIELLEGDQVLHLTRTNGASLGSLVIKDNATLIIDNFTATCYGLSAMNTSRIILINGAGLFLPNISGASYRYIYLMDDSQLVATDSYVSRLVCNNCSKASFIFSTHVERRLYIQANGAASVTLNNSLITLEIKEQATATLTNSHCYLDELSDDAQLYVSNCSVTSYNEINLSGDSKFWVVDSSIFGYLNLWDDSDVWLSSSFGYVGVDASLYGDSKLWVINSTWNHAHTLTLNDKSGLYFVNSNLTEDEIDGILVNSAQSTISSCWYLDVNVESENGGPMAGIYVEVYLPDGCLIDNRTTPADGNIQFILATRTWNNQKTESFVSYTVKASEAETTVDLDSNKQITLTINALSPDEESLPNTTTQILIVIAVVIVALIVAYLIKKRR